MELVTVIIPVYNVEAYLYKCIKSVQNQTYRHLEIILIDDGSTDQCPMICDEIALNDSRIRVFHKENGGLSCARNTGINHAQGKYIFFLDSDDYLEPETFEYLVKKIEETEADMAVCDWTWADSNGTPIEWECPKRFKEELISGEEFLYKSSIGIGWDNIIACNKLYKKELFDNLRFMEGKIHEDVFFFHEVCARCKSVVVTGRILYVHIKRPKSITQTDITVKRLDALEGFMARAVFLVKYKDIKMREAFYHTMNMFFYLAFQYTDSKGYSNKELNIIMKHQRKQVVFILLTFLKDRSRSMKEKISLCFFLFSPRIYGKLWG